MFLLRPPLFIFLTISMNSYLNFFSLLLAFFRVFFGSVAIGSLKRTVFLIGTVSVRTDVAVTPPAFTDPYPNAVFDTPAVGDEKPMSGAIESIRFMV